jgi:hypothetical protein
MSTSQKHQGWADVAMFENVEDGRALETFLRDRRFEARTYDDKLMRYFLFLRPPRVTFRVQARADQSKVISELLKTHPPAALDKVLHCPSCHSLRVNYPQMTRKFIMPTILLHLGIIFRVIEHECYCEHCHYIWHLPQDEAAAQPRREIKPFPF